MHELRYFTPDRTSAYGLNHYHMHIILYFIYQNVEFVRAGQRTVDFQKLGEFARLMHGYSLPDANQLHALSDKLDANDIHGHHANSQAQQDVIFFLLPIQQNILIKG